MPRARNDAHRKEQIRAAARRCFVRNGYAATRLLDIAREAGLSKGGVYFHYQAKEEIFKDILDMLARSLEERWSFESLSDQPADRTMASLVIAHVRTMEDEPDEVRLQHLLVTMSVQDSELRTKLEQVTQIMRALYARVIVDGIRTGVFVAGDPDTQAISVLAYIHGLGAYAVLDGENRLPVAPQAAAENVLRMLRVTSRVSAVEFGAPTQAPN